MAEYREKTIRGEVTQLRRIADAIEEILRLVKKDQEDNAAKQRQRDAG
jgi:hypothetical protein